MMNSFQRQRLADWRVLSITDGSRLREHSRAIFPCVEPIRRVCTTFETCLLAYVLCIAATSTSHAQTPSSQADQILQQVMDSDKVPSISVAVSKNGKIVYSRALGFADLANRVPATVKTSYSIGSVSKSITAVAALQLAEKKRLDLDAPVQDFCPAFPTKPNRITVRQLLAHTGGIRHYDYRRFEEDFLNKKHFGSIDEALTKFSRDPLVADPGTKYHYSSWGYVVVGCAIEGASGRPYSEYIQANIVQTAGMSNTRLDVVAKTVPDRAIGYFKSDSDSLQKAGFFDSSDRYPAGGLLSTPSDLTRFGDALLAGRLLGDEPRQQMWSSSKLSSGKDTGHGLGWKISDRDGTVSHGGTTVGTTTYLYIRREQKIVVAIAVNLSRWSKDRHALAEQIAACFLAK